MLLDAAQRQLALAADNRGLILYWPCAGVAATPMEQLHTSGCLQIVHDALCSPALAQAQPAARQLVAARHALKEQCACRRGGHVDGAAAHEQLPADRA